MGTLILNILGLILGIHLGITNYKDKEYKLASFSWFMAGFLSLRLLYHLIP